jgi:DUF2075 family protein
MGRRLNFYYKDSIDAFLKKGVPEIIGSITVSNQFDSTSEQNKAWEKQIYLLKDALRGYQGTLYFEFSIPRMGKRVDCLVIIDHIIFVIEFKVGEKRFVAQDIDQVWDYALDLKNFHEPSHDAVLVPVLVATAARDAFINIATTSHHDGLILPVRSGGGELREVVRQALLFLEQKPETRDTGKAKIDGEAYARGSYSPTPTIIEAAISLYNHHSVEEITRNDAEAINLSKTTLAISRIIDAAKTKRQKIICFVTGVPGAGKTLVGLKVATAHLDKVNGSTSVYLSGNKPLVDILQEALARDKIMREQRLGNKLTKGLARASVRAFIQIIHHYRDAYLDDPKPPYDHVAIFDEAQRAWNKEQTVNFMRRKKNQPHFDHSEPEFLISCLDRHRDWAVIVCLVGGGQEINTGEAGISEWLNAIYNKFPQWEICISTNLTDSEYAATDAIGNLEKKCVVNFDRNLHLAVSMRSFRAENLSLFVKTLLDLNIAEAKKTLSLISKKYPIVLTRDLLKAKAWLKEKARGTERYGLVVSSQAQRLKPLAIDVKSPMNPVHWFLNDKADVRSSYYLEDVATEFHVQGLELDWVCVTWDGDLRYTKDGWDTFSFVGKRWNKIHKAQRKKYLVNAYRVLLTRARQGMVIVVPEGNSQDQTRRPEYYDDTFNYLRSLGVAMI